MKKTIFVMVGMLLVVTFCYAGSYNVVTTSDQDAILQKASALYGITVQQVIDSYKNDAIAALPDKIRREKMHLIATKYDTLSDTDKAKVDGIVIPPIVVPPVMKNYTVR